jgi:membrane protein implicated in regulation of membrane protease activity
MIMDIASYANDPLTWLAIGVVLLIAELLSGDGSLFAFGLSGLLLSLFLWGTGLQMKAAWIAVIFTFDGVAIAYFARRWIRKSGRYHGDINTY